MRSTTLRRGRTSFTSRIAFERHRESIQIAMGQIPHPLARGRRICGAMCWHPLARGHEETMMRILRALFACAWLAVAAGACADSTVEVFLNSS